MARLVLRSKSHQKLGTSDKESVSSAETRRVEGPGHQHTTHNDVARSRYASPASTPGFEVLSRPKTANAIMDERRRRELMAMGSPINVDAGKQTFAFPTPLRSKYANSPIAASRPMPPPERADTPVGIALGSPSHIQQFQSPLSGSPMVSQASDFASSRDILTPIRTPGISVRSGGSREEKIQLAGESSKPKLSRWRSLGGLFAKKNSLYDTRQKETQLHQKDPRLARLDMKVYHPWEQMSPPRLRRGTDTRHTGPSTKDKKSKFTLGRSKTAPTGLRRNPDSPVPPPKDHLMVDIPTVKMDRYSVMFNGILPNEQGGLLARRQSKNANARPGTAPHAVKELSIPPMPKRANTTAAASPSYRLLVFPPNAANPSPKTPTTPGRGGSLLHRPRPKPLKRSNTAPGALSPGLKSRLSPLSPMSETTEYTETEVSSPTDIEVSTTSTSALHDEVDDAKDEMDRQALTPTPSEPSTPTTPEDGHSVHSFIPFPSHTVNASWDKTLHEHEPNWVMITIGKLAEPGDRFSGARVRVHDETSPIDTKSTAQMWHPLRMNSHLSKSRTDVTQTTSVKAADKPVVQVARSMSVTRAQGARPVLKSSPSHRGVEKARGENLVETKRAMTPTLVQVVELGEGQGAKGHKPVKSVAGLIESV